MFLKLSFLKLRADVFNQYLEENFTVFFFIMSKCVNNFLMGICFKKALESDLNTSLAITAVFDVLKAKTNDATKLTALADFDHVLCLNLLTAAEKLKKKQAEEVKASADPPAGRSLGLFGKHSGTAIPTVPPRPAILPAPAHSLSASVPG